MRIKISAYLTLRCDVGRAASQQGVPGCSLSVNGSFVIWSSRVSLFVSHDSCGIHLRFTWTAQPAVAVSAADVFIYRQSLKKRLVPCSGSHLTSSDIVGWSERSRFICPRNWSNPSRTVTGCWRPPLGDGLLWIGTAPISYVVKRSHWRGPEDNVVMLIWTDLPKQDRTCDGGCSFLFSVGEDWPLRWLVSS
jgi:hypothetical protein